MVYKAYYQFDRKERYIDEVSREKEIILSTNLIDEGYENLEINSFEDKLFNKLYVNELLNQLSTEDRFIITEIFLENNSQKKLAENLSITAVTLHRRIKKILNTLKKDNLVN